MWSWRLPTFQGSVHAANLIEACVPLTTDDLNNDNKKKKEKEKVIMTEYIYIYRLNSHSATETGGRILPECCRTAFHLPCGRQTWCLSHCHRRPPACSSGRWTGEHNSQKWGASGRELGGGHVSSLLCSAVVPRFFSFCIDAASLP